MTMDVTCLGKPTALMKSLKKKKLASTPSLYPCGRQFGTLQMMCVGLQNIQVVVT